uniref:Fc receptor-like protein 3 n=1 Tax=Phascolarctos cinereus TaxID=38626 RepID=A0A6P5KQG3_PHACI|nr:Fc receptor-like protein 3 [Phascolarctos cinereus]
MIFILCLDPQHFGQCQVPRRSSVPSPHRASPILNLQEPVYSNSSAQMELVPIYGNVNPVIKDTVYSELWSTEQGKTRKANNTKNPPEEKDSSTVYAKVKKDQPGDSEKAKAEDRSQDGASNYENVKFS